jgi:hypothetical protein|tara:strand:- start:152 stop:316 length:165 start_codon:yes stop_codon:yes gene_type:complete
MTRPRERLKRTLEPILDPRARPISSQNQRRENRPTDRTAIEILIETDRQAFIAF